ncbi:MAG: ABC transporter substrate-binding protein [Firmicutes bacterium]|nr:ABC transporter substrate-binding protein [Bacillota bacterium]
MRRHIVLVLAVALVMALMGGVAVAQQPKYGGIWKDALGANPPHLDPVFATDTTSAEVGYQIFETLVGLSPEGEVIPLLAESWEVHDGGTRFVFNLRKGVRFHATTEGGTPTANGGREVTAHDWVWSFNYICSPETNSPRAYFVDMIKGYDDYVAGKADRLAGVTALDDYTLQIETSYPFAPFIQVLTYNTFVVLPKEDIEKWGTADFNFHPVGTGPFKFEQWLQDEKIVLSRNENYWMKDEYGNQLPYLDGIEFRIIVDYTIEYTEYKLGNIFQSYVDTPYYEEAKSGAVGQFFERPQMGTYYYGFNVELEPFTDKRVRQAFNYAIDRETLIDIVLEGRASPAKGVLPPGMFGYNPDLEGYDFNPEKAKQLLAEAGYPNGLEVTLQYNTNLGHKRLAEALQAQFAMIGVKLNLRNVDWGVHLDTVERGEVPFFRMGWVVDYPDPDNFLYVLLHSDNIGPQGNYSRFNNPDFDALTEGARLEGDTEVRRHLYQLAEKIVVEEAPWLFIYHYVDHSLVKDFVKGYELPAFGQYTNKFTKVWLDQ